MSSQSTEEGTSSYSCNIFKGVSLKLLSSNGRLGPSVSFILQTWMHSEKRGKGKKENIFTFSFLRRRTPTKEECVRGPLRWERWKVRHDQRYVVEKFPTCVFESKRWGLLILSGKWDGSISFCMWTKSQLLRDFVFNLSLSLRTKGFVHESLQYNQRTKGRENTVRYNPIVTY